MCKEVSPWVSYPSHEHEAGSPDCDDCITDKRRKERAPTKEISIDKVSPYGEGEKDDGRQPIGGYAEQQRHLEALLYGRTVPPDTPDNDDDEQHNRGNDVAAVVVESGKCRVEREQHRHKTTTYCQQPEDCR